MEQTVELDIVQLLPGVDDENDGCPERLRRALQDQKGVRRAHLERERRPVTLCLHYDPDLVTVDLVRRMALQTGTQIVERYQHTLLCIEGMDCSDCALVLEHGLERLDGVLAVSVNYASQQMQVEYDNHKVDRMAIERRIHSMGYTVPAVGVRRWLGWLKENLEVLLSLMAGGLLLAGWLGETFFGFPGLLAAGLYLGAYVLGGWHVAKHAWHALRQRHFDTDLLMLLAALGAAALGEFAEGALLLFLFSFGHALEERVLDRTRRAVKALADLAPRTALVRRIGGSQAGLEVELPVEEVALEDIVLVRPGVRLPVDGLVQAGYSAIDQSPVTGESMPVEKAPGDKVFAGTVNGEGVLEVRVTRLAKDSTLNRVMQLVEEAQAQKSPTQQTVEKFERLLVPAVLILTGLVIIVPPIFGVPFHQSFMRAMTLLVAASPCALALGAPSAVLAGVARAARGGVLVKGGLHLENLGRLKAAAFDKTGTLTYGRPEVTDVIGLDPSPFGRGVGVRESDDHLLSLAAGIERFSAHPLALGISRAAAQRGLALPQVEAVESLAGRGVTGRIDGQQVLLGSEVQMAEAGVSIPEAALRQAEELESQGKTLVYVTQDCGGSQPTLAGMIALADTPRQEAAGAVAALKRLGLQHAILLTGDNPRAAAAIVGKIGLTDFEASLLPEAKLEVVSRLVQTYGTVAMVGDGVNDAPALAHATVGIAMGGAGTDVALETADVVLMGDDLRRLPFAIGLGRATRAVIHQNLGIALAVIVLLSVASLAGWAGMGLAVLLHEGSTLVVVLNALRLLVYSDQ